MRTESCRQLSNILDLLNSDARDIIIDLSVFKDINIFETLIIIQTINELVKGKNPEERKQLTVFIPDGNTFSGEFLNQIGFAEFVLNNFQASCDFSKVSNEHLLPLFRIDKEKITEYSNRFKEFLCYHLEQNIDFSGVTTVIAELLNNIYDHSKHGNAYASAQYQNGKIELVVSDWGIGIPKSVNDYLFKNENKVLSPHDAIEWALKEGNSTRSHPNNQGRGLNNTHTLLESIRGKLEIFCQGAGLAFDFKNSQAPYRISDNLSNFAGTTFVITVEVDQLTKDTEFDTFDF